MLSPTSLRLFLLFSLLSLLPSGPRAQCTGDDPREVPLGSLHLSRIPDAVESEAILEPFVPLELFGILEIDYTDIGDADAANDTNGVLAFGLRMVLPEDVFVLDVTSLVGPPDGTYLLAGDDLVHYSQVCLTEEGLLARDTPVAVFRLSVLCTRPVLDATLLVDAGPDVPAVESPQWVELIRQCTPLPGENEPSRCQHAFAEVGGIVLNPSAIETGTVSIGAIKAAFR